MVFSGGILGEYEGALLRLLQTVRARGPRDDPDKPDPSVAAFDAFLRAHLELAPSDIRGPRRQPVALSGGTLPRKGVLPRSGNETAAGNEIRTAWTVDGRRPTEERILRPSPAGWVALDYDAWYKRATTTLEVFGSHEGAESDLELLSEAAVHRKEGRTLPPALRKRVLTLWRRSRRDERAVARTPARDAGGRHADPPGVAIAGAAGRLLWESVREEYTRRIHEVAKGRDGEGDRRAAIGAGIQVRFDGLLPVDDLRVIRDLEAEKSGSVTTVALSRELAAVSERAWASGRGIVTDGSKPDLRNEMRGILDRVRVLAATGERIRVLTCRNDSDDTAGCGGVYPVRATSRARSCSTACREVSAAQRRLLGSGKPGARRQG